MTKTTRTYSDIDLNFTMHPITGDIGKIYNENAIKRSLKNLVLMLPYDCPFHPEINGNIRSLLFELMSPDIINVLQRTLENLINYYEPRVTLQSVTVSTIEDRKSISITITFTIAESSTPLTVDVVLNRVR